MLFLWRQSAFPALLIAVGVGFIYFGARTVCLCEKKLGSAQLSRLEDDCESEDGLDYRVQVLVSRAQARDKVIKEMLEGRLTLLQAAARFRAVEKALPLPFDLIRPDKGTPEAERLCQLVIECAHAWLPAYSVEDVEELRARLEEELEQNRDAYGEIHLPE
jgi:hypothetical protein